MSDTKISALPAASAALGTDELPINEAGASKKLTVAQILAYVLAAGVQPLDSDLTAIAALSTTAYGRSLLTLSAVTALPGAERDYVQFTGNVNVTAAAEATATTIVTGTALAWDGATPVWIEFFAPSSDQTIGTLLQIFLFDGSTSLGEICRIQLGSASVSWRQALRGSRRLTPSNATHTYSIRGASSGANADVTGGAGGSGNYVPGYIRITKA